MVRAMDAPDMAAAVVDSEWVNAKACLENYYSRQSHQSKLFVAASMVTDPGIAETRIG